MVDHDPLSLVMPYEHIDLGQRKFRLEWAASNGNRYPPYPQVMAISQ